jgi:hypothetical protein
MGGEYHCITTVSCFTVGALLLLLDLQEWKGQWAAHLQCAVIIVHDAFQARASSRGTMQGAPLLTTLPFSTGCHLEQVGGRGEPSP